MTGLTRAQVREIDRRAVEEYGVPSIVLMENAGRGAAELLMRLNPERMPVLVLCGKGNNGGDGFVIARHLDNAGWPVRVWAMCQTLHLAGDARINFDIARQCGFDVLCIEPPVTDPPLSDSIALHDGWIIDAIFGTGLTGTVREPFGRVIASLNTTRSSVLAVDLPSGLDCDTGEPLGVCVRATHTVTFVAPKVGFANPAAAQWLGTVHVAGIGAPHKLLAEYGV